MMSTGNGYARVPLQEQSFNTGTINAKIAETPISKFSQAKMTTPPDIIAKPNPQETASFDPSIMSNYKSPAPVQNQSTGPTNTAHSTGSALLSPAFSSPRQFSANTSSPAPQCIDPSSSLSLSDDSEPPSVKKSMTKKRAAAAAKKSKKELKESTFDLDSDHKPPYSYATLIGISILSHDDKRLPLSQIYQWISDTFRYYKREDVGWQNSIRHNLSLNKAFVKGEKSKDGKGHFWCIKPGHEEQFLKSRSVKKSSYHEVMDQISNNRLKMKEETKRTMNAIPSSPNADEKDDEPTFKGSFHYDYTYTKGDQDDHDDDPVDDEDSDDELNIPKKRRQLNSVLGEPFSQKTPHLAHPSSNHHSAHQNLASLTKTPKPMSIFVESPNKPLLAGKNLTYTSSFSCKSNLELSPIRPSETGPILEPLTPANNTFHSQVLNLSQHASQTASNSSSSHHLHFSLHPVLGQYKPSLQQPNQNQQLQVNTPNMLRTPKSNRTPMRNLKTPQSSSIMKKLWNSPSYLEDFYYSPLTNNTSNINSHNNGHGVLTSYDDDDMVIRSFEHHPQQHRSPIVTKKSERLGLEQGLNDEPFDLAARMASTLTDED